MERQTASDGLPFWEFPGLIDGCRAPTAGRGAGGRGSVRCAARHRATGAMAFSPGIVGGPLRHSADARNFN